MSKLNFKLRIFIYCILAAILPFIISWVSLYHKIDTKLQNDLIQSNYTYVQEQVDRINLVFKHQEDMMRTIAKAYPYISGDKAAIIPFLNQQLKVAKDFLNIYIIAPDGKIYPSSSSPIPNIDATRLNSYVSPRKNGGLLWLEPYTDLLSNEKCIGIAMPIYDQSGDDGGVLVANISMKTFGKLLDSVKYQNNVELLLLNPSGYVKYDSSGHFSEPVNINDVDFVLSQISQEIMKNGEGYKQISTDNKSWMCIFSSIDSNGWKIVSLLDSGEFLSNAASINRDMYVYIFIFGTLSILMVIGASMIISISISKPLLKLRDGAKEVAKGNLEHRIFVQGNDEIGEVAEAFNEMACNLKNNYEDFHNNNEQLQEANIELEASFEQLEATMGQLNESEEKYRTLMNNISDMVFVINYQDNIVYVNNTVEKILGYSETDLVGKPITSIMKDILIASPFKAAFSKDYSEYQLKLTKKDGSELIVEGSTKRVIEDEKVVAVQAIARDITTRKSMEGKLERRYYELQVLNRISRAITSTIDLNALLYTIVNQVVEVSNAVVCSIRLNDPREPNKLVLKAVQGIGSDSVSRKAIDLRKDIIGKVMESKRSMIIPLTVDNLPSEYFNMIFKQEAARYVVFNPLVVQNTSIGVMSTTTREKPSDDDMELLGSMANNIAIAIDNARAYDHLKQSYLKTVQSLVSIVEAKDLYTESHSLRVAKYASFIAIEMGHTKSFIEDIWVAGVLHDIGKIGISDAILNKKDRLTEEEYQLIKQHPDIAYKILLNIGLKEEIIIAIRQHHERFDGRGYPDRINGVSITHMAAIISVANAFDAITSKRPYKEAKSIRHGINEVVSNRGLQFDPKIVDIFETVYLMKPDIFDKIYNNEEFALF